jgi:hypothetical protein
LKYNGYKIYNGKSDSTEGFSCFFVISYAQSLIQVRVHPVLVPESQLIYVASLLRVLKKCAMMQKANVSHGKAKTGKVVRRGELPYTRRSRSLYRVSVVSGTVSVSMEKKGMKKQRRSKRKELMENRGSYSRQERSVKLPSAPSPNLKSPLVLTFFLLSLYFCKERRW